MSTGSKGICSTCRYSFLMCAFTCVHLLIVIQHAHIVVIPLYVIVISTSISVICSWYVILELLHSLSINIHIHTLGYLVTRLNLDLLSMSRFVSPIFINNSLIIFYLQNYVCRLSVVPLVPSDWSVD